VRKSAWLFSCVCVVALVGAACSSNNSDSGFANNGGGSSGGSGSGGGGSNGGGNGGSGGSSGSTPGNFGDASASGGGTSGGSTCNVTNKNADMDGDGWTPNQGDCNDCDPNVNPGAIDTWHQPADGGAGYWGDEDCSNSPGDNAKPCDQGLALTDLTPMDGAKAIELCATASMSDKKYGVISANYVRADGSAFPTVGAQVGIQQAFGTNVHVQGGQSMLVISSGYARTVGQAGACNGISCVTNTTGTPPPGFPQDDPACPPTKAIADDIALELQIRAPTNATGYSFDFKFYSFEYPDWVCDTSGYNDQFVTLVNPPPMGSYVPSGSMFGNISFDSNNHPVSVNMGFFDVCDPTTPTRFASHCKSGGGTCPPTPNPYCPMGTGELAGTGFDVWHTGTGPAGATKWLQTQAPVKPGSIITIRFAMWDAGNALFDSTTLIDNFKWIATGGSIPVGTTPEPMPQ
jgi:hypothetical protein